MNTKSAKKSLAPKKDCMISLSNKVNLDMIWIKRGMFIMGSPEGELGRCDNEILHKVLLSKCYWLGKYPVTQAQYEAIMGGIPSCFKGGDLPMVRLSWYEAMVFCKKLTEIEKAAGRLPKGYEYTLPTEAQWEYACRAGTTTALNSGKNLSDLEKCPEMDEVGWYAYNSGEYDSDGNWTNNGGTFPVGQKQPNDWGFYDMHGNVWEWCLDWYSDGYLASSVTDPKGASTGSDRVLRGGSWYSGACGCRSACRNRSSPGSGSIDRGFRVALSPIQ